MHQSKNNEHQIYKTNLRRKIQLQILPEHLLDRMNKFNAKFEFSFSQWYRLVLEINTRLSLGKAETRKFLIEVPKNSFFFFFFFFTKLSLTAFGFIFSCIFTSFIDTLDEYDGLY